MISYYLISNWFYLIIFIVPAFIASLFISMIIDLFFLNTKLNYISWNHITKKGYRYTRGFFLILLPFTYTILVGINFYINIEPYSQSKKIDLLIQENKFFEVTKYTAKEKGVSYPTVTKYFSMYKDKLINNEIVLNEEYLIQYTEYIDKICGGLYLRCYYSMQVDLYNLATELKNKEITNLYNKFNNKYELIYEAEKRRMKEREENKKRKKELEKNQPDLVEETGKKVGEIYKEAKDTASDAVKPVKKTINKFMKGFKEALD